MRLAQKRPDDRVMPARLVDGEAADMIELGLEAVPALGERSVAKRGSPVDDDTGGLALSMGIDDPHCALILGAGPGGVPGAECREPPLGHALLRRAQSVEVIEMKRVFVVAHERHQALEIKHEIDALVENREGREGALKLERKPTRLSVALGGALAKLDQPQHFAREYIADPGDGAARPRN